MKRRKVTFAEATAQLESFRPALAAMGLDEAVITAWHADGDVEDLADGGEAYFALERWDVTFRVGARASITIGRRAQVSS